MKPGRILVAGFEGFGTHRSNPSSDIVLPAVQAKDVDTVRMPVDFDAAFPALQEAYDKDTHTDVLLFGLGSHATNALNIETRARNFDMSVLFADANGHRRLGKIEPGAPFHRETTANNVLVKEAVEASGMRARFSRDAGTYVCNHVLYQALGEFEVPVGFVHIGRSVKDESLVAAAQSITAALRDT